MAPSWLPRVPIVPLAALLAACQQAPAEAPALSAARFADSASLEGRALGPGGAAIADSLAYLADPDEELKLFGGKLIGALTDGSGRYKFTGGVPAKASVVLVVTISADRRVTGFTTTQAGANRLDVSVATTYTTEWLRQRAATLKKPMGSFDLARLPDLIKRTQAALDADRLPEPDLRIAGLAAMNRAYALAIGTNADGLGDAWAAMTGQRTLVVRTVAGGGPAGPGPEDAPGPEARFYQPRGLAVSGKGEVYLADRGNHRIRKLDPATGRVVTIAGTGTEGLAGDAGPALAARFRHPEGVLLDRQEKFLYVFDTGNRRIRRITLETGRIDAFAGDDPPPVTVPRDTRGPQIPGTAGAPDAMTGDGGEAARALLRGPRSGAFDSQGNLYFTDVAADPPTHLIRKIAPSGVITTYAGTRGQPGGFAGENALAESARLNDPHQLWVSADDQLYVADTGNRCVRKIDTGTRLITTMAGRGGQGTDAPEADGQLATATRLDRPVGVAVDAKGRIWIGDRGLGRLYVVKADGKLATVAGGGTDDADGDARRARLVTPGAVWAEADGDTLLIEEDAVRLRRAVTKHGL